MASGLLLQVSAGVSGLCGSPSRSATPERVSSYARSGVFGENANLWHSNYSTRRYGVSTSPALLCVAENRGLRGPHRRLFDKESRNACWSSHHFGANDAGIRKTRSRCQSLSEEQQSVSDEDFFAAQALDLLADDEAQNFFDRLARAWSILFPINRRLTTNADIAKQRLKMILISDRCSVNDEAKRRIVNNIVGALSDFVEIESEDKVALTVSSDPNLGTVYSVTVPVRRVKPEYQEYSRELQNVALCEDFRTLDLKLEYQSESSEGQS